MQRVQYQRNVKAKLHLRTDHYLSPGGGGGGEGGAGGGRWGGGGGGAEGGGFRAK